MSRLNRRSASYHLFRIFYILNPLLLTSRKLQFYPLFHIGLRATCWAHLIHYVLIVVRVQRFFKPPVDFLLLRIQMFSSVQF